MSPVVWAFRSMTVKFHTILQASLFRSEQLALFKWLAYTLDMRMVDISLDFIWFTKKSIYTKK